MPCTLHIFNIHLLLFIQLLPKRLQRTPREVDKSQSKRPRKYRSCYNLNSIKLPLDLVAKGETVYKAAKRCNIPDQTLRDRVSGRISSDTVKSGARPMFTMAQEDAFAEHIKFMSDVGYAYTRTEALEVATDMAEFCGKKKYFTRRNGINKQMCHTWLDRFIKRHPDLKLGHPRSLSMARARASSLSALDSYFQELDKIMNKYDLKDHPELIFNLDETGFQTEHSPPAAVGTGKCMQAITSPRSSTVTLIACVKAIGNSLPPYLIFKGQRYINTNILISDNFKIIYLF